MTWKNLKKWFVVYLLTVVILYGPTWAFLTLLHTSLASLSRIVQAGLIELGFFFLIGGFIGAGCLLVMQVIAKIIHLRLLMGKKESLYGVKLQAKLSSMPDTLKEISGLIAALTKAPVWLAASIIGLALIALGAYVRHIILL